MKTICCTNMPFAGEAFASLGDVALLDGRQITADDVRDADILATRSTTRITPALLDGSRVRFVGTATIGTDHLDIPYLESRGITWCSSPGCNANSVGEYIVSALLCLATRHGLDLRDMTLGIIGVGNVGRRVLLKAEALGLRVLQNDPPRARTEPDHADTFVSRDRLLAESDIVTLHVPLTHEGKDATFHMADDAFFAAMKDGAVFIDAARGPVVETPALVDALDSGKLAHAVIDTWEGEPGFRPELLRRVDLATPHIAGHSFEGKAMGTVMVYEAACAFLGVEPAWDVATVMPESPVPHVDLDCAGRTDMDVLWDLVQRLYDIREDDARLRQAPEDDAGRAAHFDGLRKNYPMRREFRFTSVNLLHASPTLVQTVKNLEFQLGATAADT